MHPLLPKEPVFVELWLHPIRRRTHAGRPTRRAAPDLVSEGGHFSHQPLDAKSRPLARLALVSISQNDGAPVEILGFHPVPGRGDAYLLEVVVHRPAGSFDVGLFTQEDPHQPRDNWQVAYDERYLNSEGTEVLSWNEPPAQAGESTRLAFFMFSLDLRRPLLTAFGPVSLPPPTEAPPRLLAIAPFEPPD